MSSYVHVYMHRTYMHACTHTYLLKYIHTDSCMSVYIYVYIYIYIYIYMCVCVCDSSMGVHRYTRWTDRLSHQTSNLSCPCYLLPQGCHPCFARYLTVPWGCTGTLDGLVGSHTRLAIYPTLAICYQRVVICALLDTRFKGV